MTWLVKGRVTWFCDATVGRHHRYSIEAYFLLVIIRVLFVQGEPAVQHLSHFPVSRSPSSGSVWLGLTDRQSPGLLLWPSGASLGSFAPWDAYSPVTSSPTEQMCVSMTTTAWSSVECDEELPFVCEYPAEGRVAILGSCSGNSSESTP